jgi:hypothetical protein
MAWGKEAVVVALLKFSSRCSRIAEDTVRGREGLMKLVGGLLLIVINM